MKALKETVHELLFFFGLTSKPLARHIENKSLPKNVIAGHFSAQKRYRNILKSKLRNGEYALERQIHYRIIIYGEEHIYSIVELSNIFGSDLKLGGKRPDY